MPQGMSDVPPPIPWFLRSRWRLFAAGSLVLAFVLAVPAMLMSHQIGRSLHAHSVQENQRTAQLAARIVESHFDGLRRYIESYSRRQLFLDAVQRRDVAESEKFLHEIVRANPHFEQAFVTDAEGRLWVDYPAAPARGQSLAALDWFTGASQRQSTYVSGINQTAGSSPAQVLAVAVPLRDRRQRVIGYLVGQHAVDTLVRWLSQLELSSTVRLSLVDPYGVLAASVDQSAATPALAQHPIVGRALAGGTGWEETVDPITARPMLISYAAVSAAGWAVLARESVDAVYEPIARFQRSVFVMTALLFVAMFVLGTPAITMLQRYHRALSASEQRFRGFLDSAPDAVVIGRRSGQIEVVNAQTERLFGYRRGELVGQSIDLLLAERCREPYRERCADCVAATPSATKATALELWARRKDGDEFPVAISMSAIVTEDGPLMFSDIRDVTRQKQTERELRTSEARFRALAQTANDAVISADHQGTIIYANHAAELIFGYPTAEIVGQPVTLLMPERFHAAHRVGIERLAKGGAPHVIGKTVELAGRRRDGREFPLEISLASWTADGQIYFAGVLRDITPRKRDEQRIVELNAGLERRASDLEALNKELEAFSYSVSHDLRAPLRAIDGFSQALIEDYGASLDATAHDYLARVRRGAQRMGQLIDDMLKLSRVSRTELALEDVDLSALAQEVWSEIARQNPHRNVQVVIAPGLRAQADMSLMRIVLENLLGNAWKFTGRTADARVEFGARVIDGRQAFYVRDTGAGFDMAYAAKLFGAFQRLHEAHEFPGSGIGLATVQRVVSRHGGRVWAEGAPGAGATFYFTLT